MAHRDWKTTFVITAALAVFAAGAVRYGFPPMRMGAAAPQAEPAHSAATPDATTATAGRIVVTVNNGAPEDDAKRQAEQKLLTRQFERKFPDATVHFEIWAFSPDSYMAKYVGGTLTDIVGLFATEATLILDRRMAADITDELRAWPLFKHLRPRMLDLISRDGRIYGMPVGGAVSGDHLPYAEAWPPLLAAAALRLVSLVDRDDLFLLIAEQVARADRG